MDAEGQAHFLTLNNNLELLKSDIEYIDQITDTFKTRLHQAGIEITDAIDIPSDQVLDLIKDLDPTDAIKVVNDNIKTFDTKINDLSYIITYTK